LRVLGYDSGAERMGFSVVAGDGQTAPEYIDSGIAKFPRNGKDYQPYKLELIQHWTYLAPYQFNKYDPDAVVCETLPAVGFNNAIQAELAKAAITTVIAMAFEREIPVYQIAAITVKTRIGGNKRASKVAVRNGAISLLPELEPRKFEWTEAKKTMDEPDALGVSLAQLGYRVPRVLR
jgi:Holliday junction resolvasome RuvABC endonuclease subunit